MALNAGVLRVTVEFAQGLKDTDWFGKIDPYALVKVGNQQFRTRTLSGAGTSPVWNETFTFNIINDNSLEISLFDEDVGRDDHLGVATIALAKVRTSKEDKVQAPVIRKKSFKQKGFVSVSLKFEPNDSMKPAAPVSYAPPAYVYSPSMPQQYAPSQAYPPQGYAPQGYVPQGYPPPVPYGHSVTMLPQQYAHTPQYAHPTLQYSPSTAAAPGYYPATPQYQPSPSMPAGTQGYWLQAPPAPAPGRHYPPPCGHYH